MSEYSRSNFVTTILSLFSDALPSKASTRANVRTLSDHVKDSAVFQEDMNPVTASGTNTYTCSMLNPLTSYSNGRFFLVKFTNANTTAATLNVNSLGAKSIVKNGATALDSGDIQAGSIKLLGYDGTNFQIEGTTISGASSGTYTPTLTNTTNVAASTAFAAQWMRVGNVVTVSGLVQITPTSGGGTITVLRMSLPVASNFVNSEQLGGIHHNTSENTGIIYAATAADNAEFYYLSTAAAAANRVFMFTYQIL